MVSGVEVGPSAGSRGRRVLPSEAAVHVPAALPEALTAVSHGFLQDYQIPLGTLLAANTSLSNPDKVNVGTLISLPSSQK